VIDERLEHLYLATGNFGATDATQEFLGFTAKH
jgi:hypothetical protein